MSDQLHEVNNTREKNAWVSEKWVDNPDQKPQFTSLFFLLYYFKK